VIQHIWNEGYEMRAIHNEDASVLSEMYCYVVFKSEDEGETWAPHKKKGFGFVQHILDNRKNYLPLPPSVRKAQEEKRRQEEKEKREQREKIDRELTPEFRKKKCQELFNKCDRNKDKVIDSNELQAMMSDSEFNAFLSASGVNLACCFDHLDANGDGKISFKEFENVITTYSIDIKPYSDDAAQRCIDIWMNTKYTTGRVLQNPDADLFKEGLFCIQVEMKQFLIDMNNELTKEKREQIFDEDTIRTLQEAKIDPSMNGNSRIWWGAPGKGLKHYSVKAINALEKVLNYETNKEQKRLSIHALIGFFVRINYELRKDDNISCFLLNKIKPPRLIFRSGTMVDLHNEESVYRNMIKNANVKHVVNLYAGPYPLKDVHQKEKQIIEENGGTHHDERDVRPLRKWRYLIQKPEGYNNEDKKVEAMDIVANVIKDILLPKGKEPKENENVLIHCGGGMHRTGMIIGIIRKVFSDADMEKDIIPDYRRHVAFVSEKDPRGREPLNEQFIKDFPADKIKNLKAVKEKEVADGICGERGY